MVRKTAITITAVTIVLVGLSSVMSAASAAPTAGKCTSLQARCAIAVGGRCNLKTGRWRYRCSNVAAGCVARFNDCIARGLARRD